MTAKRLRVYVDANVLLAYVSDEPNRADTVQSLLEDADSGTVHLSTSYLSIAEVAYIASDQEPNGGTAGEARIDELWTPSSPITLAEISIPVARKARSVIRKARLNRVKGVRSADAIHLASAEVNGCDRFFTYEKRSTRVVWDTLIQPDISKPYVEAPRLPGVSF